MSQSICKLQGGFFSPLSFIFSIMWAKLLFKIKSSMQFSSQLRLHHLTAEAINEIFAQKYTHNMHKLFVHTYTHYLLSPGSQSHKPHPTHTDTQTSFKFWACFASETQWESFSFFYFPSFVFILNLYLIYTKILFIIIMLF